LLTIEKVDAGSNIALETKAQDQFTLDALSKEAVLGYARIDLIKLRSRIQFQNWNPRLVNPKQVKLLARSFRSEGMQRFSPDYAIPLVMSPSMFDAATCSSDPTLGIWLPELTLTTDDEPILAAGGQHRLEALVICTQELRKELHELEEEEKATKQKVEETQDAALVKIWVDGKAKLLEQKQKEDRLGGQWMVVIYDSGISYLLQIHIYLMYMF
jgi:hypothetical protein